MLALCAAPRIAAVAFFAPAAETQYSGLARSLADAHRYALNGAATARMEPLCPTVFALGRVLFRCVRLQAEGAWPMLVIPLALACVAGVALFSLTRAATSSARAAWIATVLYAFSPYLVRQSASLMEVTVAAALLIAAARAFGDAGTNARAAACGLLLAAIVLTRFSFAPVAAGGLWLIWRRWGMRRAALAAAVLAASVGPWMAYSRATDGSPWPARVGENLFVSTNEWTRAIVPAMNVDLLVPLATDLVRAEPDPDRALTRRAIDYARRHPMTVVALKLRNVAYALQPRLVPFTERAGSASIVDGVLVVPEQRRRPVAYELIAASFQTVLLAGTAAGLWKRRGRLGDDAFLLIVLASIVAVEVIFFPTSRLLAPATFVLMFYTGAAFEPSRGRVGG